MPYRPQNDQKISGHFETIPAARIHRAYLLDRDMPVRDARRGGSYGPLGYFFALAGGAAGVFAVTADAIAVSLLVRVAVSASSAACVTGSLDGGIAAICAAKLLTSWITELVALVLFATSAVIDVRSIAIEFSFAMMMFNLVRISR